MNIYKDNMNLIIDEVSDFDIEEILECGQCFNFIKLRYKEYIIKAMDKLLHIKQENNKVTLFNTSIEEYNNIWSKYFDMDNNYSYIKSKIIQYDDRLVDMVSLHSGVRIINQSFFETLISFIVSQNKQIPHIKQIISTLSVKYGNKAGEVYGESYYTFPSVEILNQVNEQELRDCKVGFRAPYIKDACSKVYSGEINENDLKNMDINMARKKLMTIKGVGEKVANCVLLFALGKREAFPVDVWMKRIMEEMYFHKETKKEEIERFALDLYKDVAGYAQQYLFYYARDKKIKK